MRKILFLDVDGVLNDHAFDIDAQSCTIDQSCVAALNRVLKVTSCDIVISSAWRYMILGGAMSAKGFEYLLRTHGVHCVDKVVGYTRPDAKIYKPGDVIDQAERGKEILDWLNVFDWFNMRQVPGHPVAFVVVDDKQLGFERMPFVQTDGLVGLTEADADKIIALFGDTT